MPNRETGPAGYPSRRLSLPPTICMARSGRPSHPARRDRCASSYTVGRVNRTGCVHELARPAPPPQSVALRTGFRARGMALMSYNGGMTSAAHAEGGIDETVAAFEAIVADLVRDRRAATLG